jgi:hypothetical protein
MRMENLILRCYAERKGGQWQAFCLDLCLAAQGDSFEQTRQKLSAMIEDYVFDALQGEDREYAPQLLSRKAPLGYWLKYYGYVLLAKAGMLGGEIRKLFESVLPLTLARHP